jgi:hypothetical protein
MQEKHHPLHAPLEEIFDLSRVQFGNSDHDKNIAEGSQLTKPTYTKP